MEIIHILNTIRDPAMVMTVVGLIFFFNKNYVTKETAKTEVKTIATRLEQLEHDILDIRKEFVTREKLIDSLSPVMVQLTRIEAVINDMWGEIRELRSKD